MNSDYIDTPIGLILIEADEKGLTKVGLVKTKIEQENPNIHTTAAKTQLKEYFAGARKIFDLKYNLESGPPFHQKVWLELLKIPFGHTVSYLTIAKKLGDPNSTRAVGMANGKNPIAIIIPCHRVIGSDGSLTGYAYGTDIKRQLLAWENPKEYAVNGNLFSS